MFNIQCSEMRREMAQKCLFEPAYTISREVGLML